MQAMITTKLPIVLALGLALPSLGTEPASLAKGEKALALIVVASDYGTGLAL